MPNGVAQISSCPDCASTNIIVSAVRDQVICRDCGLIFEPFAPMERKPVKRPTVKPRKAKPARRPRKPAKKAKPRKAKKGKRRK